MAVLQVLLHVKFEGNIKICITKIYSVYETYIQLKSWQNQEGPCKVTITQITKIFVPMEMCSHKEHTCKI